MKVSWLKGFNANLISFFLNTNVSGCVLILHFDADINIHGSTLMLAVGAGVDLTVSTVCVSVCVIVVVVGLHVSSEFET